MVPTPRVPSREWSTRRVRLPLSLRPTSHVLELTTTARTLRWIGQVGLLPACNHQQVPFAYKMFTRDDELGWKQSTSFKKAFSIDVDIDFIGVWYVPFASRSHIPTSH